MFWDSPCCSSLILVLRFTISPIISSTRTRHTVIPDFSASGRMANIAHPANHSENWYQTFRLIVLASCERGMYYANNRTGCCKTESTACHPTPHNKVCVRLSYKTYRARIQWIEIRQCPRGEILVRRQAQRLSDVMVLAGIAGTCQIIPRVGRLAFPWF